MPVYVSDEQSHSGIDADRLGQLARYVLTDRGVPDAMEVSVRCVDIAEMTELNRSHMCQDGPTDVLAFPLDEPKDTADGPTAILGDVVVCPAVAQRQAHDHGKNGQKELDLLVVHGLLHLLGHDHAETDEKAAMFELTDALLAGFARTGSYRQSRDLR